MIIAIDFDGTIVKHEYPNIGEEVSRAIFWIKKFQEEGAKIILYTMRSDEKLQAAVNYCEKNGIDLWGVNKNPDQYKWTNSNKVYAHAYIDDAAFGCPLISPRKGRPYADWQKIGPDMMKKILDK